MEVKSYAKINLALDVLGKSGNYHEIITVFQQIPLHDTITFSPIRAPKKANPATIIAPIEISCSNPEVPAGNINGHLNTAYKSAKILSDYARSRKIKTTPFHIHIEKRIPPASGLGGASSNGAVVLTALNNLWNLNLSQNKLQEIAEEIGMDVPFFLYGGTAVGEHFGEKITPLPTFNCPAVKIEINGKKSGTKEMYSKLDLSKTCTQTEKTKQMIELLKQNAPADKIIPLIHNDFEQLYPTSESPAQPPKDEHSKKTFLSGSGSAFYRFIS